MVGQGRLLGWSCISQYGQQGSLHPWLATKTFDLNAISSIETRFKKAFPLERYIPAKIYFPTSLSPTCGLIFLWGTLNNSSD
jgi:hypothetical protein